MNIHAKPLTICRSSEKSIILVTPTDVPVNVPPIVAKRHGRLIWSSTSLMRLLGGQAEKGVHPDRWNEFHIPWMKLFYGAKCRGWLSSYCSCSSLLTLPIMDNYITNPL